MIKSTTLEYADLVCVRNRTCNIEFDIGDYDVVLQRVMSKTYGATVVDQGYVLLVFCDI